MKKKLFIICSLIFTAGRSFSQNSAPRELKCTEQAITFKSNFRSGWHFSRPVIGNSSYLKTGPAFMQGMNDLPGHILPIELRLNSYKTDKPQPLPKVSEFKKIDTLYLKTSPL